MDLAAVSLELKNALQAIPVIKEAYAFIPDGVNRVPAAYVGLPDSLTYDATMARGLDTLDVAVTVLVGRYDSDDTYRTLQMLMSGSDTGSVKYRLQLDRQLNGSCSNLRVASAENIRVITYGEVGYLAADFRLTVAG